MNTKLGTRRARKAGSVPQYYKNKKYFQWLGVSTKPSNIFRRIFIWHQYYVGQQVFFHITVRKLTGNDALNLSRYSIREKLPGAQHSREVQWLDDVDVYSANITNVKHIGTEGNIVYKLCYESDFDNGEYIFTAHATSPDTRNAVIGNLLAGGALTLIVQLIIKIIGDVVVPIWEK